jgi:hypothetical protein
MEQMADAYDYAAEQVLHFDKIKLQEALKYIEKVKAKIRRHLQPGQLFYESINFKIMHEVKYRKFNKMHKDGYWEGEKAKQEEMSVTSKLSPYQLSIVNRQINDVVNLEHFRASMGLTNFSHQ